MRTSADGEPSPKISSNPYQITSVTEEFEDGGENGKTENAGVRSYLGKIDAHL